MQQTDGRACMQVCMSMHRASWPLPRALAHLPCGDARSPAVSCRLFEWDMFLKLAALRTIHGMMFNGAGGANGGAANAANPPPVARTTFTHVPGDPSRKIEDRWQLPGDSPVVTSFPFLRWVIDGNPQTATAPRSSVAGTLMLVSRRPTDQEWSNLDNAPFLSTELDHGAGSTWAHQMDIVGAFSKVYSRFGAWKEAVPALTQKVANPALIQLEEDSFATSVVWSQRAGPADLAPYALVTIGDLLRANESFSASEFMPAALSRATILMGSKDNTVERADPASTCRIAAERITSLLSRTLATNAPSNASLANKFPSVMAELHLPYRFCMHATIAPTAMRELDLAHRYAVGSTPEREAIERDLILNIDQSFPSFTPVLSRCTGAVQAHVQIGRLTSQLLPPALASSPTMVKFAELDTLLARAAWRATITHAVNSDPAISGEALVSALIASQAEISAPAAGLQPAGGAGPSGDSSNNIAGGSYGSVREQVLGDALRSSEARSALTQSASLSGVDLVEALMQSGATILTRAMLLQEAWLHNKSPELGFCSLAAPYLGPYFAATLTEDMTLGSVPERLRSYVWPYSELETARTIHWSKLKILDWALEIDRLSTGSRYHAVSDMDRFTVDSSLRKISEIGSRFFFALNLSLHPQSGFSFTDGVDNAAQGCRHCT